jgi:large subunit ribosomal protein LP2
MRYVAAALLTALAGEEVTAEKIRKILGSVGVDCDDQKVGIVVSELADKNIEEVLVVGHGKMASMSGMGGGGGGGAAAAAAPVEEAVTEAKEEVKEEDEDSEDDDMGFGLFD